MIRRDDPGAIRLALHAAGGAPDRLQPADMRLGKAFGGERIMLEVHIDAVTAAVCGSDVGDCTVDLPGLGIPRRDTHDAAVGRRFRQLAFADVYPMAFAVNAVDDEVMPIVDFVGEPARDEAADDRWGGLFTSIVDKVIGGTASEPLASQLAVHGLDDVAAFAGAAQRGFQLIIQAPADRVDLLGQAQPPCAMVSVVRSGAAGTAEPASEVDEERVLLHRFPKKATGRNCPCGPWRSFGRACDILVRLRDTTMFSDRRARGSSPAGIDPLRVETGAP